MRVEIGEGVRLYFDVDGLGLVADGATMRQKPTMVLLHGGPGFDHSLFKPWWSRFSDTHQVVYVDQRGHGRSDQRDDPTHWQLDVWAEDVVRLCEALDIENPVVVGNSFGGVVAMHYAARFPEHPSKLVLSSCSARFDLEATVAAFEQLGGAEASVLARRFWTDGPDETRADYARVCVPLYTQSSGVGADAERTLRNSAVTTHWVLGERPGLDLLDELADIRCPTLVLAGELDPIATVSSQRAMASHLRGDLLRLELLADCGHGTYRDQPQRTEEILRDFLAQP